MYKLIASTIIIALSMAVAFSLVSSNKVQSDAYRIGAIESVGYLVECQGVTDSKVVAQYEAALNAAKENGQDVGGAYICE